MNNVTQKVLFFALITMIGLPVFASETESDSWDYFKIFADEVWEEMCSQKISIVQTETPPRRIDRVVLAQEWMQYGQNRSNGRVRGRAEVPAANGQALQKMNVDFILNKDN